MESLFHITAESGYFTLFALVFLEVIGLPIPAAIALFASGALAASGDLSVGASLATALSAMVLGDTLMFFIGRSTGWWLLGMLCSLSLHPDSCILSAADAFYKRGRMVLVFARFVPGISTLASPLAGSMNMPVLQYYLHDLAGACLYIGGYFTLGYLLSGFVGGFERGFRLFGHYAEMGIGVGLAAYIAYRAWAWYRARPTGPIVRVRAEDVSERLGSVAIYDVRSHGYYQKNTRRIPGSVRLDPYSLAVAIPEFPPDKHIILYCTCRGEATSGRVARFLAEKGVHAYVLTGGLRAWLKAGLPVEPVPEHEMVALPTFS